MPNVSFRDPLPESTTAATAAVEAPAEVVESTPAPQALAAPANTAVSTHVASAPSGLEGDIQQSDIKLPRINLVQKTSQLVDAGYRPGDIVFKNGESVVPLNSPHEITVLKLRKQYQQKLPFNSPETPEVYDTAAEVRAAGGTTTYGEERYFEEIAHVQILFPAPTDLPAEMEDLFPYEFGGVSYAMAMFTAGGSNYTNFAKPVITAMMGPLRNAHWTGKWMIQSDLRKNAQGSWNVIVPKMAGRHTPEFAEFARGFLG